MSFPVDSLCDVPNCSQDVDGTILVGKERAMVKLCKAHMTVFENDIRVQLAEAQASFDDMNGWRRRSSSSSSYLFSSAPSSPVPPVDTSCPASPVPLSMVAVQLEGTRTHRPSSPLLTGIESPSAFVMEVEGVRLCKKDMDSVENRGWLTDEIVRVVAKMIVSRSVRFGMRRCALLGEVHLLTTLELGLHAFESDNDKKKLRDETDGDVLLLPINKNNLHWTVAIGARGQSENVLSYIDPMNTVDEEMMVRLKALVLLLNEVDRVCGRGGPKWGLKQVFLENQFVQIDSYSCGVYACLLMDLSSRDIPFDFGEQEMEEVRQQIMSAIMAKEIGTNGFRHIGNDLVIGV